MPACGEVVEVFQELTCPISKIPLYKNLFRARMTRFAKNIGPKAYKLFI